MSSFGMCDRCAVVRFGAVTHNTDIDRLHAESDPQLALRTSSADPVSRFSRWSEDADQDFRVACADHIAVGELPVLNRGTVHGSAVGRTEIGEHRDLAVPADVDVAARHTCVGEAELSVLPATDDVAALAELVVAAAAVLELQSRRQNTSGRGRGLLVAATRICLLLVALIGLLVTGVCVTLIRVTLLAVRLLLVAGIGVT